MDDLDSISDIPQDDAVELHQLREDFDKILPAVDSIIHTLSALHQSSPDDDDSDSSLPLTSPDFIKAVNQLQQFRR